MTLVFPAGIFMSMNRRTRMPFAELREYTLTIHYIFMSYFYCYFVFVEHFDPHEFWNACLPTDFQPFNDMSRRILRKHYFNTWFRYIESVLTGLATNCSAAFFLHSFNSSCHLQFHRNVWSRPIQFNCRLKMSNYLNFE